MSRIASVLCILTLLVSDVNSQEVSLPTAPPPMMGEAQLVGDVLVVSFASPMPTEQTRSAVRKVNGKDVPYTFTVRMMVCVPQMLAVQSGDYRVLDLQGRSLPPQDLSARLKKSTPVLVSEESRRLDAVYASLYKPDMLVVYLRPSRPKPPPFRGHRPYGGPVPSEAPPESPPPDASQVPSA